jgi:hypothetical protein
MKKKDNIKDPTDYNDIYLMTMNAIDIDTGEIIGQYDSNGDLIYSNINFVEDNKFNHEESDDILDKSDDILDKSDDILDKSDDIVDKSDDIYDCELYQKENTKRKKSKEDKNIKKGKSKKLKNQDKSTKRSVDFSIDDI